jgi:hypothetical protein
MDSSVDVELVVPTKNPIQETETQTENLTVCENGDTKCFSRLVQAIGDCV